MVMSCISGGGGGPHFSELVTFLPQSLKPLYIPYLAQQNALDFQCLDELDIIIVVFNTKFSHS